MDNFHIKGQAKYLLSGVWNWCDFYYKCHIVQAVSKQHIKIYLYAYIAYVHIMLRAQHSLLHPLTTTDDWFFRCSITGLFEGQDAITISIQVAKHFMNLSKAVAQFRLVTWSDGLRQLSVSFLLSRCFTHVHWLDSIRFMAFWEQRGTVCPFSILV